MYCSRKLFKGNSYEICLPLVDSGVTMVRFYTTGSVIVEKEPEIVEDSMCFSFTEEELAVLPDGVLRMEVVTEYETTDTNTPYVIVTPGDYSGTTLDEMLDDAYQSGYTEGQEDCTGGTCEWAYESGYTDGYGSGSTEGYSSGYTQGYAEGEDAQKGRMITTSVTVNGTYSREDGYSSIEVDVPSTGYTKQELDEAYLKGWYKGKYGYEMDYFSVKAGEDGQLIVNRDGLNSGIYYAMNAEDYQAGYVADWYPVTQGLAISMHSGETVSFKGTNANASGLLRDNTLIFDAYGNIESLEYGDNFMYMTMSLTDKSGLFSGCTGLNSSGDLILPGIYLARYVYKEMFKGCTSLRNTPNLPADDAVEGCYQGMFEGCTSLTSTGVLPATKVNEYAYNRMFKDCTSLRSVGKFNMLHLQSGHECESMFEGCTSLTTVPQLMPPHLWSYSYKRMFYGCSSLSAITCTATYLAKEYYSGEPRGTEDWLYGVSPTGDFTRFATMHDWESGASGIPDGWTELTTYA